MAKRQLPTPWTPRQRRCIEAFGENAVVGHASQGHSGPGWYVWDAECPEDGACFLARRRPKRVRVKQ